MITQPSRHGEAGRISKPVFYSYVSKDSGQRYDSAAWTNLVESSVGVELAKSNRCMASKRKAAAAKALLTMRRSRN